MSFKPDKEAINKDHFGQFLIIPGNVNFKKHKYPTLYFRMTYQGTTPFSYGRYSYSPNDRATIWRNWENFAWWAGKWIILHDDWNFDGFDHGKENLNLLRMRCFYFNQTNNGPYCTNSGYYHTKNLLCEAAGEIKDITFTSGCTELPGCDNPDDTLVCGENFEVMTQIDACTYMEKGIINNYFACDGDCHTYCLEQKCLDSFKTNQCTLARVCVDGVGKSYDTAQQFCEHNPNLTFADVVSVAGSITGSDHGNEKNVDTCCDEEAIGIKSCTPSGFPIPFDYLTPCKSRAYFTDNDVWVGNISDPDCGNYKQCIFNNTPFPICLTNGDFYRTLAEFCKEHHADWEATLATMRSCTGNICNSSLSCKQENCREELNSDLANPTCSEHYIILRTETEKCLWTESLGKEVLQCNGSDCDLEGCLDRVNTEYKDIFPACDVRNAGADIADAAAMATLLASNELSYDDYYCGANCSKCSAWGTAYGECITAFTSSTFPQCSDFNGEHKLFANKEDLCHYLAVNDVAADYTDFAFLG